MSEPDSGRTVDEDGVRVEKSFTEDAFPVPAVRYDLSSDREDAVRVRIVDQIPESFPMDRIGFHPDYESDNWTAYKDHRVEFERVLEPGDAVETVFGIRDDDPDLDGFLETPVIEHVPVGEEIEDVLGAGDTDAVREVLAGDRTTLPGMEEATESDPETDDTGDVGPTGEGDTVEPIDTDTTDATDATDAALAEAELDVTDHGSEESAESDSPVPRTVGDGRTAAVTPRDDASEAPDEPEETTPTDAEHEPAVPDLEDEPEPDDGATTSDEVPDLDHGSEPDNGAATADEHRPSVDVEGGVAAALAAEIRSGEADPEDIRTIESEFDDGVPRSVDVRIGRLQSSVADIEAYADALAEFIDGEGTAREILEDLNDQIDAVESTVSTLDDRADDAETARTELRDDLSRVDDTVDDVADDVSAVDGRVDGIESSVESVEASVESVEASVEAATTDIARIDEETDGIADDVAGLTDDVEAVSAGLDAVESDVDATDDRVDDVESRLGRFDEEFDDLWDDLAEVDTRLTEVEDRLGDDLDDIEAELDAIDDHLEELEAFRKRLNEAFGP
ncbi:hypothetical protein [Halorubrum sp. BV1]|uniref:hypothetical protein n=1 Tax=Halorubrum sp. BV1 TaxID=1498500 RepID=UPI000678F24C|nr:hypothetical protein [Halorubrum sp. BV1]